MSKKNYAKDTKEFDLEYVLQIFNSLFDGNEDIDISSKLSDLYNSLKSNIEKRKMIYELNNRLVFSMDECKKLQSHLPIYYDIENGKRLENFIWLEAPEGILSNNSIDFLNKLKNSNLSISGIYMEHENTDFSTQYTLDEAIDTCVAIGSFLNEIENKEKKYDVIENALEKLAEDIEYNYQAVDIDEKLLKDGYLLDKEEIDELRRSHSVYGSLVEHKAMCSGIAKTVKAILKYYGVEVNIICNEKHAWNQIKVNDREKYNLDLTTAVVSKINKNILDLLEDDEKFYSNSVYDGVFEKCKLFKCTMSEKNIDKEK